ncbi:glycosyltransferase family 2 protein [Marinoscillum sp.]|uniref:glycosyltransferase family 2 protein n=1 Tax=Marinoscillum sp. TaxID=2024838 RepID=UPI003BA88EC9
MSKVAVVILNYNGRDHLLRFLPTLIAHSSDAEIIVADNCSTDDSLSVLKQFPTVRTILLDQNHGYAGGYNEALKQVKSAYYLLVNSDVEVTLNWITPLEHFLDENKDYAAVQPKILDFNRKEFFEYAGAAGGFLDLLGYPYCRGRIFDTLEQDTGQYDTSIDIFWASGACFMIRSEVFHQAGGFDADFFAHMEEIDLCWRVKSLGLKIACVPKSVIYHVGGGTLNKTSPRKTYLNFRNGISLLIKNLPLPTLMVALPIRLVLDWMAALLFWKNESFSHFTAVFKAHVDALKVVFRQIKPNIRSGTRLRNQGNVILPIAYYVLRKRNFKKINNTK